MTPTHRVEHVLETCPDCGTGLAGGWVQRSREVIDIPLVPVQVTEHLFIARTCPVCEGRRVPQASLEGVTLGRQRLGLNLLSLIAGLRGRGTIALSHHPMVPQDSTPVAPERGRLGPGHQADSSTGPTGGGRDKGAHPSQPGGTGRRDGLATGGGQRLTSGFSAPPGSGTSSAEAGTRRWVDEVLGESFKGVLVSDFYAAYNHYPGLKQRCWVHLLRGHPGPEGPLPQGRQARPVGGGSP